MKRLLISVLILSVLSVCAHAAEYSLADCRAVYEKESAKNEEAHQKEINRALTSYSKNLDVTASSYRNAGDLYGMLAVRKEKSRFQKEKNVPEDVPSDLPPLIQKAQTFYHEAAVKARAEKAKTMTMLTDLYLKRLDAIKKGLVYQVKLDEAIVVDSEMKRVELVIADIQSRVPKVVPQPRPSSELPTRSSLAPKAGQEMALDLGGGVQMEMVWIPAGEFKMGSPDHEETRKADEWPVHRVTITKGFWLGKYEVTQEQYEQVTGKNPSKFKGAKNPVEMVTWNAAKGFCETVSKRTGKPIRLPTEAEWEYACRAGTTTKYNTGDDKSDLSKAGWWRGNSGGKPQLVGQKAPNRFGMYDMHGNVWEWCQDWYGTYTSGKVTDPLGPASGSSRVLRGGGWDFDARGCRVAGRFRDPPDYSSYAIGFRACLPPGQ